MSNAIFWHVHAWYIKGSKYWLSAPKKHQNLSSKLYYFGFTDFLTYKTLLDKYTEPSKCHGFPLLFLSTYQLFSHVLCQVICRVFCWLFCREKVEGNHGTYWALYKYHPYIAHLFSSLAHFSMNLGTIVTDLLLFPRAQRSPSTKGFLKPLKINLDI